MAEFRRIMHWQGFDRWATPVWQMVPLNGERYVCLRGGAGLTVSSVNPAAVVVTEITAAQLPAGDKEAVQAGDRFFKLEGKLWRNVSIVAKTAAGVIAAELTADVKKRLDYTLAFNFVEDNAGHSTTRAVASATGWLATINGIFNGQTNIFFRQTVARKVTVNKNLGTAVRWASGVAGMTAADHEWPDVIAKGDATASMNFFLVWEYEQDPITVVDGADAGTLGANCIFEDHAGSQIGETMAHEIGHFLKCGDHYVVARKHELMYGITDARGRHIGKAHANIMNL